MCKIIHLKLHPPRSLLKYLIFFITIPNFCSSSIILSNSSSSSATNSSISSPAKLLQSNNASSTGRTTTSPPRNIPPLLKPILPLPLTQKQAEEDMKEKCQEFVGSSQNNEFHSPGYPDNYFHNVNCVKVITAGDGEVIRLRFLDHFHIEPSENCHYDYLEIRDGQYGYSSQLYSLCGSSPPTVIESSGKHLWLRFHSDMDIHYIGFKAFYEFVPSSKGRPDFDDCSFYRTEVDGDIESAALSPDILVNRKELSLQHLDCTWHIEAPPPQRILVQFELFELEQANDCTFNFVEVFGSRTEYFGTDGILKRYCGSDSETVQSNTNVLHLRFFTTLKNDDSEIGIGFKTKLDAYYSFYRDLADKIPSPDGKTMVEQEPCIVGEEFDCTDSTCISKELTCNLKPNCKQRNDEDKTKCDAGKATFKMTMDLIVIAFIGCFLAAGMCSGLFLNICRKLRQDKIEMEEIRASLHKSSRDSMGNSKNSSKHQSKDDLKSIQEIVDRPSKSSSKRDLEKQQQPPQQDFQNLRSSSTPSVSSPPPNNNSSSSQENNGTPGSSSESKETVVYRPYYRNPEVLIGGGGNTSAPPPPNQSTTPYGFVLKNQPSNQPQPQQQESTNIPYSPPPPYNPLLGKYNPPLLSSTPKPTKKSVMVQDEEVAPQEDEEVHVIEVRDCACQTKESFTERYLKEVYFGGPKYYAPRPSSSSSIRSSPAATMLGGASGGSGSLKRAPLARGEAVEFLDPVHPRKHLRRVPKGSADVLMMMYPRSPASICSSVDASTGSLELLSELDEELIAKEQADDIERVGASSSRKGSGYNELE